MKTAMLVDVILEMILHIHGRTGTMVILIFQVKQVFWALQVSNLKSVIHVNNQVRLRFSKIKIVPQVCCKCHLNESAWGSTV